MDELRDRVERFVREHELIPPGGEVTCLVSGGADSTCLWHLLGVARLPRLGAAREPQAARRRLRGGRPLLRRRARRGGRRARRPRPLRGALREQRRSVAPRPAARDRATPPRTRSRRSSTGSSRAARRPASRRDASDGVVHPLLPLWREETEAYCRAAGLEFRVDASNADTKRGLIRDEILPLLRRLHPAADENLLRALDTPRDAAAGARRAARGARRLEARRPRRRPPGGARARAPLARARAGRAGRRDQLGRLDYPLGAPRP